VHGIGSGSCPWRASGISGVQPSGSTIKGLMVMMLMMMIMMISKK
jgi:hypothetical protein